MNRQSIKLSDVKVTVRFRKEMGDIASLADSISRYGLVQPIVLTPDFTLVAGERRYRAHEHLKRETIDYVLVQDLPEEALREIELEENIRRKAMTWQEEALGVLHIYRVRKQQAALEGWKWGQQLAASMFGMAVGTVNYVLVVAKRLEEEQDLPPEKRRIWNFDSVSEAYRLGILMEQEDAALARLAELAKTRVNTAEQQKALDFIVKEVKSVEVRPDALAEIRARYEANKLNVEPFDVYWTKKQALAAESERVIYLSTRLHQDDCLNYMLANLGRFDHIITDPPYGIDLENLNQQNQHGGMVDLDRVEATHQVDQNVEQLAKFFQAAWGCTKDKACVVVFGDMMQWQHMYDSAIKVGFSVQRWPIVWKKVNQSVMNNCASYNTTKDYEIIMICRKPGATLATKMNTSFIEGSNVEVTKLTGHPFAKPFEVTRRLIELISVENQSILDPFAGGGSIVLEILKANRHAFGVEIETHQYNALLENVKRLHYLRIRPDFIFK